MKNEDRLFAWLAGFFQDGYERYVRFMCAIYGGEPAKRAGDLAERTSWDTREKAP